MISRAINHYQVELFRSGRLATVKVPAKDRRAAIRLAEKQWPGWEAISAKSDNPMPGGGGLKGHR